MKRSAGVVACMVIAGSAYAQPDAALAQLEHQLPAGWSMLATDTELVLRHDRPCYVRREVHENAPATEHTVPAAAGTTGQQATGNRQQAMATGQCHQSRSHHVTAARHACSPHCPVESVAIARCLLPVAC